ncbi:MULTISPECIES: hypothetical protein [Niastella]|uniref:Uncharacterized protein n=1 Tax=Niastella soli TaxID=2821487 RepID=A0ABS3YRS7_9BACT|nr:hypothetical protein [Niastella soli]MBO9200602.1 hypothetical protein [Niastella soli]
MKSHHHDSLWSNETHRLTAAQIANPNLILADFFQSYHLQDVREIMWRWVTEVVSSPNGQANDHHERSNYLFFYEKIEALVEAAWVINQKGGKGTSTTRQPTQIVTPELKEIKLKPVQGTQFTKPVRLIEKAIFQPAEVIAEVFDLTTVDELQKYLLPNWLRVAVISAESPYSDGNGRAILYEFYDQLLAFVEALYLNSATDRHLILLYLNEEQGADPAGVITAFFQQFSIEYIRRELADFLEAGIGHDGAYPNGFSPWQAWLAYNHVLCLVEAAYQLYLKQQVLSVVNAMPREWEVVE